ncbi:MAG: efflux RND transporter periplasmic adaptor subunit, partial [Novosphingobium sp.]|nr:efflux RND transporter periplasmic adaptor subunit [Novosphingobium sp.]
MGSRQSWIAAVAVMVALAMILGGYKLARQMFSDMALAAAPEPVEAIHSVRARVAPFTAEVRSVGSVVATRTVEIRNELAGTVTYVGFNSGQVVRKGSVLLRMDISEERARLAAQTARAAVATKNLERSRELVERGFISQAQIDLLTSESRAAGAEAAAIRALISKKEIRSPFTGRAGIHDLHPGQYLEEGTNITTVQGIDSHRYVDFSLPAQSAASLDPGEVVRVGGTGLPSDGINATVIARDSSMTDSRMVKYRVSVSVAPDNLLPGSFADIFVPTGTEAPTVFVPRTAVNQRPHASYVFVMSPEGKGQFRARQKVVRLGPTLDDEVAIVS